MSKFSIEQLHSPAAVELMRRLGISQAELRANIKPIFLWMYDHGITELSIERKDASDTVPVITINGSPLPCKAQRDG